MKIQKLFQVEEKFILKEAVDGGGGGRGGVVRVCMANVYFTSSACNLLSA